MKLLFKCDNCDHIMPKKDMEDVGEMDADMLTPGSILPSGRCPKPDCGAGCYPLVLDLASRKVLKAIHSVWDALSAIIEEEPVGKRIPVDELHKNALKAIKKLRKALPVALHN